MGYGGTRRRGSRAPVARGCVSAARAARWRRMRRMTGTAIRYTPHGLPGPLRTSPGRPVPSSRPVVPSRVTSPARWDAAAACRPSLKPRSPLSSVCISGQRPRPESRSNCRAVNKPPLIMIRAIRAQEAPPFLGHAGQSFGKRRRLEKVSGFSVPDCSHRMRYRVSVACKHGMPVASIAIVVDA